MLKKLRKSSGRVTLVLIGVAALAGCSEDDKRRDVYASKEDCLADWATSPRTARRQREAPSGMGYWYGPTYRYRSARAARAGPAAARALVVALRGSAPSGISRGGFGSSGTPRAARPWSAKKLVPRLDWPRKVEELGFHFHTIDGVYWDERACYRFTPPRWTSSRRPPTSSRSAASMRSTRVIEKGDFTRFAIPEDFHALIVQSWEGRRKLALTGASTCPWDGTGEPKMLEYNADTPTALLEASVCSGTGCRTSSRRRPVQLDPRAPHRALEGDARRLPPTGASISPAIASPRRTRETSTTFATPRCRRTSQALPIDIGEIGWDGARFVDMENRPIGALFKLYPWEWMVREEFGTNLLTARCG
jgi:hypothetical protein